MMQIANSKTWHRVPLRSHRRMIPAPKHTVSYIRIWIKNLLKSKAVIHLSFRNLLPHAWCIQKSYSMNWKLWEPYRVNYFHIESLSQPIEGFFLKAYPSLPVERLLLEAYFYLLRDFSKYIPTYYRISSRSISITIDGFLLEVYPYLLRHFSKYIPNYYRISDGSISLPIEGFLLECISLPIEGHVTSPRNVPNLTESSIILKIALT